MKATFKTDHLDCTEFLLCSELKNLYPVQEGGGHRILGGRGCREETFGRDQAHLCFSQGLKRMSVIYSFPSGIKKQYLRSLYIYDNVSTILIERSDCFLL